MSKELIVAGSIVAACVGLTVVAFVQPAEKPAEVETVSTDPVDSDPYATTSSSTSPYDTTSSSSSSTFPGGSSTSFPGDSSSSSTFPGDTSTSFPGSSTTFPGSSTTTTEPVIAPPVEPALPVVTTPVERSHTVAKGDTLGEISKQYYGTTRHWKKIKEANNCDENGLAIGQKLIIPAIASETPTSTAVGSSSAEGLYVVKSGDSYYRIAERELGNAGRAREIEKLNGIAADDLKPGQKLVLPPRSGSESTTSSSSSSTSASAEVPPGARVHVVAKDEYLIDISEKYYGTTSKWKRIADANPGVNPNRLMVGQKLVIPDAGGSSAASSSGSSSSTPVASGDDYVVQKGDTLEKIAKKLLGDGSKWKDIAKLNPGVDPERLMVGQKLAVPAGAAKPAPTVDPIPKPVSVPDRFPAPPPVEAFPAPGSSSFPAPTTGADPAFPANDAFPPPAGGNPFPGASSSEGLPPPTTPSPSASPWDDLPTLPPAGSEAEPVPAPPRDDPWNQFGTNR